MIANEIQGTQLTFQKVNNRVTRYSYLIKSQIMSSASGLYNSQLPENQSFCKS